MLIKILISEELSRLEIYTKNTYLSFIKDKEVEQRPFSLIQAKSYLFYHKISALIRIMAINNPIHVKEIVIMIKGIIKLESIDGEENLLILAG